MKRKSLFTICFVFFVMGIALSQESKFQQGYFREAEPPPLIHPGDNWYQISLSNASFEDGIGDYPSDWDRWGEGEFFWSREAFDGKRSAGISKTDWSTGWRSPSFPVFADYQSDYPWYFCEAFIRTKGASGRIFLSIAWYGEKGWLGNSRSPYFPYPDTDSWYRIILFALAPKGAIRGEVILRVDKEITGEVLFDSVKLYSFSLPLSTPVGEDFDSPYLSFLTDYPTHPLAFYSYLQIAQFAEDKWEGKREKNELLSAISGYDNIAKHFPLYRAWALIREADISIRGKDYRRAEEIGEKLLKEFPQCKGEAYYLLSEAYKVAMDYQKAFSYAKQALENSKSEEWFISRAKLNEAFALEHMGKWEEAVDKYKELANQHPDQLFLALLGEANCFFLARHFKECLEVVEGLLNNYPDLYPEALSEAEWIKGKCLISLGYSDDEIIKQFKRIIEKFPNMLVSAGAYMQIMEIHLRKGNTELASKELEEIIQLFKDKYPNIVSMAISCMGTFFFEKGDYKKAIEWYSKAGEAVPQFADNSLIRVGECYKISGQYEEAIKAFQQILDKFPQSDQCPKALLLQGQCLFQMGRKVEAQDVFKKILELYPKREEAKEAKDWIELCKD